MRRGWTLTRSWSMWSALILTSWICVLLANANGASPRNPPDDKPYTARQHREYADASGYPRQDIPIAVHVQQQPPAPRGDPPSPQPQQRDYWQPRGGWSQKWLDDWLSPPVLVSIALVVVTTLVFIVYALILGAMIRQLGEMRATADAAKESADAAKENARILANAERPHLAIQIIPPLENMDHPIAPNDPINRSVHLDIANHGRSPGWATQVLVHMVVHYLPDLQEEGSPKYREAEAVPVGGMIVPGGVMHEHVHGPMLALTGKQLADWKSRTPRLGNLFLYGFVDYTDINGNPHRSCFAYRYVDWEAGKAPYFLIVNNRQFWNYY